MNVSIVIPNRNGARLLQQNLPSVITAAKGTEVIVVDDGSGDDSSTVLAKDFPSVRVIRRDRHEGYASTVNAGVKEAGGEIVILLNTDVRPDKHFLAPLTKHFNDPVVFAVGCMEKSIEGGKTILRGRGVATWEKGFFIHSRGEVNKTTTAWVAGGSGAFRKSMWEELGGMDTIYNPFYWEDIDLSYRALKAGYKVLFESRSVVIHEHEQGAIMKGYLPMHVRMIAYRNQFLFIWKNVSDPGIMFAHVLWTPITLIKALFLGDVVQLAAYVWAVLYVVHVISSRLQGRRHWKLTDTVIALR